MDHANQRLETGYEPIHVDVWRPDLRLNGEAIYTKKFTASTKTKGEFPNENSLLKLLYLGLMNAKEKWTMPIHNWNLTLSQLAIYFNGRLNNVITL